MSAAELPASAPAQGADALTPPDTPAHTLWQRACDRLAMELPEQQYNTWIRPLPQAEISQAEGVTMVSVRVPNRFMLDWIRTQYSARLEAILSELQSGELRMDIALAPRAAPPMAQGGARPGIPAPGRALPPNAHANGHAMPPQQGRASTGYAQQSGASYNQHNGAQAPYPLSEPQIRSARNLPQVMGLNPGLTFDNLVPGRANQMARTAALHVAGAPGQMYNPLFIYGGVGLGKTHLMNAVGNALLADKPDARILYLHAEQFISDVVKNYQRKTFD